MADGEEDSTPRGDAIDTPRLRDRFPNGDPASDDERTAQREEATAARRAKLDAWAKDQRAAAEYTSCREIVEKKRATYPDIEKAILAGEFEPPNGRSGVFLWHPKMDDPEPMGPEELADVCRIFVEQPEIVAEQYLANCWIRSDLWRAWEENRGKLPYERGAKAAIEQKAATDARKPGGRPTRRADIRTVLAGADLNKPNKVLIRHVHSSLGSGPGLSDDVILRVLAPLRKHQR